MDCDKGFNVTEFNGVKTMLVENIEDCKRCPEFQDDFCGYWCCLVFES